MSLQSGIRNGLLVESLAVGVIWLSLGMPAHCQEVDARDQGATTPGTGSTAPTATAVQEGPRKPARTLLRAFETTFAVGQGVDAHSTLYALQRCKNRCVEGNSVMSGLVDKPVAFVAVKAAATVGIVAVSERLARRHPKAALGLMIGLTSLYATVDASNYRHAAN